MEPRPAAARVAWEIPIETDDVEIALVLWHDAYRVKHSSEPDDTAIASARSVLKRRINNEVPPLPSASSSSLRLTFIEGIPKEHE